MVINDYYIKITMKLFTEDSISVKQFQHLKKSLTKALDKKLALNKSFDISDKDYFKKYPFLTELKIEIFKTNHKVEQVDSMAVILNNYFNSAWKEIGEESIKLKRNFEKDLEQILFLIYKEEIEEVEEFDSFFKSHEQFQQMIKLLDDNNFNPEKRNLKPIELNILLVKIDKLNLLKHEYIEYKFTASARNFYKVIRKGSFSRLKTSYENDSLTHINLERFNDLQFLDIIVNNKKVNKSILT